MSERNAKMLKKFAASVGLSPRAAIGAWMKLTQQQRDAFRKRWEKG
jgi:hypothetical protein